jgi:hypothetical protein
MGAARSGQVFGWALFVVGAYLVLARPDYSWLWFIILGLVPDQRGEEPTGGGAVAAAYGGGAGGHDRRPGHRAGVGDGHPVPA